MEGQWNPPPQLLGKEGISWADHFLSPSLHKAGQKWGPLHAGGSFLTHLAKVIQMLEAGSLPSPHTRRSQIQRLKSACKLRLHQVPRLAAQSSRAEMGRMAELKVLRGAETSRGSPRSRPEGYAAPRHT